MGRVSLIKGHALRWERHPTFPSAHRAYLSTREMTDAFVNLLLKIEPRGEIPPHIHEDRIDALYILEGEGEAVVNGERQRCGPGDYIFAPPLTEHGIRNMGNKLLLIHATFCPR